MADQGVSLDEPQDDPMDVGADSCDEYDEGEPNRTSGMVEST